MGRVYVQSNNIATFTEGDIIELNAAAGHSLRIWRIHVGALTETNDSSELLLHRATVAGVGGATTGITPNPTQESAAFGGTYREAATTDAAGTLTELGRWKFSSLLSVDEIYTPETTPWVPPSGRIVLNMDTTITSTTLVWMVVFEETP